ncbi:hypothetical protein M5040_06680 [Neisseria meningitidis]|jgi:hypothetical protein|nr:hypothetical protein [Neisseria meningitidis]
MKTKFEQIQAKLGLIMENKENQSEIQAIVQQIKVQAIGRVPKCFCGKDKKEEAANWKKRRNAQREREAEEVKVHILNKYYQHIAYAVGELKKSVDEAKKEALYWAQYRADSFNGNYVKVES